MAISSVAVPNDDEPDDEHGEFIIYRSHDGRTEVQLRAVAGTVWMTQKQMAMLFGVTPQAISAHILAVTREGELEPESTFKKLLKEPGHDRSVNHYSLEMILAVGYRIRGPLGVEFRLWASTVLREYLIKGFAMNDARLKDPAGKDYFAELLARIRDIRTSEARLYKQILDLLAESYDYVKGAARNETFFKTIQNKLHFAITGNTAPEIVMMRANPSEPNMGLTSWPGKNVCKKDAAIAKNYLTHDEVDRLNLLTSQFLDYADGMTRRRKKIVMDDWLQKVDDFIEFNEYAVLDGAGLVSHTAAVNAAEERYKIFADKRAAESRDEDFAAQLPELRRIEREILAARNRLER